MTYKYKDVLKIIYICILVELAIFFLYNDGVSLKFAIANSYLFFLGLIAVKFLTIGVIKFIIF